MNKRGLIGNDIVKILRPLKSADNRLVCPFQNLNDPTLATCSLPASALRRQAITDNPRNHPIPVHRGALVLS